MISLGVNPIWRPVSCNIFYALLSISPENPRTLQLSSERVAITHPIFRVPIEGAAPGFRVPLATDSDL